MDSCNFTRKANLHAFKVEIPHGKNYAILVAMMRKRSYFVKKVASRSPGVECSYGKILIPVTEISVAGSAQPLILVARRDLGNRASPVDRAHMKRRLVENSNTLAYEGV